MVPPGELIAGAVCVVLAFLIVVSRRAPGPWIDMLLGGFGIGGLDARTSAAFFLATGGLSFVAASYLLSAYSGLGPVWRTVDAVAIALVLTLVLLWVAGRLRGRGPGLGD